MNSLALALIAASDKPLAPEDYRPAGYVAMAIVGILIVATYFLLRSFIKHTHKAKQPWEGDDNGTHRP